MSEEKNEQIINSDNNTETSKKLNISVILNIVLLVGLIVLYVLYFTGYPEKEIADKDKVESKRDAGINIGFVDTDQLIENYDLAQKLKDDMLAEQNRLESDLTLKQREFQQEVENFQRQIQQGFITAEEAQRKEQELMQRQQQLMMLNEEYSQKLRQKEIDFNNELFDSITNFVERNKELFGYELILNYSSGGGVLYGEKSYDITEQFIEKLNKEYRGN